MKLSTRARYGLKAMVDLAERYGGGMVSTSALAALQGISDAYLEQLIAALRRAGGPRRVCLIPAACGNQRGGCAAGVGRQHGSDGVRGHQPGLLRQRVLLQRPTFVAQAPTPH